MWTGKWEILGARTKVTSRPMCPSIRVLNKLLPLSEYVHRKNQRPAAACLHRNLTISMSQPTETKMPLSTFKTAHDEEKESLRFPSLQSSVSQAIRNCEAGPAAKQLVACKVQQPPLKTKSYNPERRLSLIDGGLSYW